MFVITRRLVIAAAVLFGTNHGLAAPVAIDTSTLDEKEGSDSRFGLGFTTSIAQRPFIGVDDQDTSLIYIQLRHKEFYIQGLNIGYELFEGDDVSLDLLATPRFYEAEPAFAGNGELDGIDKTRRTYFAGLSTQYHVRSVTLTLQLLADLRESDGNEIVATASKNFKPANDITLAPAVGITYQDADLVDHFYGVQADEVRADRPAYGGHSSSNYHVAINASWDATQHIRLLGQVKYEALGSGITDSPIVDEDSIILAAAGFVYRF